MGVTKGVAPTVSLQILSRLASRGSTYYNLLETISMVETSWQGPSERLCGQNREARVAAARGAKPGARSFGHVDVPPDDGAAAVGVGGVALCSVCLVDGHTMAPLPTRLTRDDVDITRAHVNAECFAPLRVM